ncbi:hypothetical protein D3Z36_06940 [Lachnospiraceae bacterium]|nr:hypothetical protein [Lachnospiraceae bacterium]
MPEPGKDTADSKTGKKKISVSMVIAIVAILAVLVLAVVLVYVLTKEEPKKDLDGKATIVTEGNVEEVIGEMENRNTDASYTATMTNEWTFENGEAAAEGFYVKNTENNSRTVYFELKLKDTDEVIYSSPYISVGEEMNTLTLDKKLDAGDYNAVMVYHLVDDEKEELTTVSVAVVIHIKN